MRNYTKNLETSKIELRFEKSDYMSMSEAEKGCIKSAFLFSSYGSCWVSRAKLPNTWSAENVCKNLGAVYQGEEGEKLSFAEQVERTQEKAENRAEYMSSHAEKAERESTEAWERSNKIASYIPFGQPILVGHHSERRHRSDIAKIHNAMNKSVELSNKSEYYQERAETAKRTAEGAQYSNPVYLGNRIREVETKLRELNRYLSGIDLVNRETGERGTKEKPLSVSDAQRENWTARVAEETEKLDFFKGKLADCGIEINTKKSLKEKKCTHVKYRGTWYPVKSINAKSVTVLNWMGIPGAAWKWTVHYPDIKGIKIFEDMFVVYDRDGNESKPAIKY